MSYAFVLVKFILVKDTLYEVWSFNVIKLFVLNFLKKKQLYVSCAFFCTNFKLTKIVGFASTAAIGSVVDKLDRMTIECRGYQPT